MNPRAGRTRNQKERHVKSHGNAPAAGSTQGQGGQRGSARRDFAPRDVFSGTTAGRGSSHFRFLRMSAGLLTMALFALALLAATASADGRIGGTNSFPENLLAGGLVAGNGAGVAASQKEGGDVYLLDLNTNHRIDQFESDGTFVRAFGYGIVPGAAVGTGDLRAGFNTIKNVTTTTGAFGTGSFHRAEISFRALESSLEHR